MSDPDYPVCLEIAGPLAMFTNPETGSAPRSYPVPTWSAAKGMFEAVARVPGACILPTRVWICAPIRYERYWFNHAGMHASGHYQLKSEVLADVCYRVYGVARNIDPPVREMNPAHHLHALFMRRLRNGRYFRTPCLGWRQFGPDYFGPDRSETRPLDALHFTLPSLLLTPFSRPVDGQFAPRFQREVVIRGGILTYDWVGA